MSAHENIFGESTERTFHDGRVRLFAGDCLAVLDTLAENSIDSVVCDPPYALVSITKRFGADGAAPAKFGKDGLYQRASAGFMNRTWDTGKVAFNPECWAKVLRVLKPGGHIVAFGGDRTFHRLVCAIEDAGAEIRHTICWIYGSGFPKSLDVSKQLDKLAGVEREVIRERYTAKRIKPGATVVREGAYGKQEINFTATDTAPATDAARQWEGWGTALKPAIELICLARKPLIGTVVENVLTHGTGAINVDACRVFTNEMITTSRNTALGMMNDDGWKPKPTSFTSHPQGRWPANLAISYPEDEFELRWDVTSDQKRELYRWLSENA